VPDLYRVACAAGFSGDRLGVAKPLVDELKRLGGPSCLIFESLAERTLALAQLERRQNETLGYEPLLAEMLSPILADCVKADIPIVGNFGAANPRAAAQLIQQLASEQGIENIKIAIVYGDDIARPEYEKILKSSLSEKDQILLEGSALVSANVYLGAKEIANALSAGAQVVVTGRVADPALTVGPLMAYFQKSWDDWSFLAAATMAGHLLECGAQVTGGYFADPGYKEVPNMSDIGFPIVEFDESGNITVTKPIHSGGLVNRMTVTEQLLYELHDPAQYLTPDVIADITQAEVVECGENRVRVVGVQGHPKPHTLKANICIDGGWLAEAEISYAGPRAYQRAHLAAQIIRDRLGDALNLRIDFIGSASLFTSDTGKGPAIIDQEYRDIRLRVAAAHRDRAMAIQVCREVTALYTCGPAGGGGVRTSLKPRLNTLVGFVPREEVVASFEFYQGAAS
jgi:hypothetical protein